MDGIHKIDRKYNNYRVIVVNGVHADGTLVNNNIVISSSVFLWNCSFGIFGDRM